MARREMMKPAQAVLWRMVSILTLPPDRGTSRPAAPRFVPRRAQFSAIFVQSEVLRAGTSRGPGAVSRCLRRMALYSFPWLSARLVFNARNMTIRKLLLGFFLSAFFTSRAADVSGRWQFTLISFGEETDSVRVELKADGKKLTGTANE